jgi:hypothetical protein
MQVCDRGTSGVITDDSETFRLQKLKLTVVGRRCIAPDRGGVCERRAD